MVAMGCTIWLLWDRYGYYEAYISIYLFAFYKVVKKPYKSIRIQYILPVYRTA